MAANTGDPIMTSLIPFKDILISARQESYRMRHYFLGVEHLFIALLEIKRGLTSNIISDHGLTPEYVIDAIRRKAGKGSRHRLWAGVPNTPRTDVVIGIAQEIAREQNRQTIQERDLLIAVLDEQDSIPSRVLQSLGLDLQELRDEAQTRETSKTVSTRTFVAIEFSGAFDGELDNNHLFILRRMFHGYAKIRVETRLAGGYTSACLLVVTPIHIDAREDASVVVKIGHTDPILDEAQRYDRYVRGTLPPLTARLEERPVAPDTSDLAALKYTLLTDSEGNPNDLRSIINEWSGDKLGQWLHDRLYKGFGDKWWKQSRPYRFEAWQEYDWVLPPILTLELLRGSQIPTTAKELRVPVRRSQLDALEYGDVIQVKSFIVQSVNRDRNAIKIALGQGTNTTRAYQIEVRGIDFEKDTYYRGEIVEQIIGRIWKTRGGELIHSLRALEPDFDITGESITINEAKLPNPIKVYQKMIDRRVHGTLSTIHGDLHLGNILIGPNNIALLIDFGRTRDGHTIFDWSTLEVSILSEWIAPRLAINWTGAKELLKYLVKINRHLPINAPGDLNEALQAIVSLRQIIKSCLASPDHWEEYYLSLALVSLRAMTWETMPIESRRMMYLVSALCIFEYEKLTAQPIAREKVTDPTELDGTDTGYFAGLGLPAATDQESENDDTTDNRGKL